jgi:hypothetical protein
MFSWLTKELPLCLSLSLTPISIFPLTIFPTPTPIHNLPAQAPHSVLFVVATTFELWRRLVDMTLDSQVVKCSTCLMHARTEDYIF